MRILSLILILGLIAGCRPLDNQPIEPVTPDAPVMPDEPVEPSPDAGTPIEVVFTASTTCKCGEIIDIDASQSKGNPKHWSWDVLPPVKTVIRDNGKVLGMCSYPGQYRITLTIANVNGIATKTHLLTVTNCDGGGVNPPSPVPLPPSPLPSPDPINPNPPTPPAPNPPKPDVVINPGVYGVANVAYYESLKVTDSQRVEVSKVIADEAEGLASKIAAGGVRGAMNIISEIGTTLDSATNENWDGWRKSLSDRLKVIYYTEKKLKSDNNWAEMLREVAEAMKQVK